MGPNPPLGQAVQCLLEADPDGRHEAEHLVGVDLAHACEHPHTQKRFAISQFTWVSHGAAVGARATLRCADQAVSSLGGHYGR